MATVKNTITLQDRFTPVLRTMIKALNSTVTAMAGVDQVSDKVFKQVKRDVEAANKALDEFNRDIKNMPDPVNNTNKGFANWGANLGGALYTVEKIYDKLTSTAEKMDEINARGARANMVAGVYGGITGEEIQAQVTQAAINARGDVGIMMDAVGKMGIMAKDAFKNPKELIAFNEQLQKTFVIAGAGSAQIDSAMLQLTQAMASGVLRGEEFNAVFEAAPNIIQRIAEYTGKTTGQMKKMAEDGMLTAEVVKYAMLSAAEETNAAFESMPMSFQAVTNRIQTDIDNFLTPLGKRFSWFWQMLIDNWSIVKPVLTGITVALGALAVGLGIASVAQWALNSAMLANPMTWVIVGIVALIAAIVSLTLWVLDLWETNMEFKYGVIKIWNDILNFFDNVPIFFQWVGNGIASAFGDAKVTVLEIMEGMGNGVIKTINDIIWALNKIPGVSIEPLNQLTFAAGSALEEEAKRQSRNANLEIAKEGAAAKAAARESQRLIDKAQDEASIAAKKLAAEEDSKLKIPKFGDLKIKGGKLDKINGDIGIKDEDIKLLKDTAATEFVNRYTTMKPEMTVNFGDVKETADVKKILEVIEEMVEEAYASSLVGEGI